MATAATVVPNFRHTFVFGMAAREMAEHMAAFPWKAPSVLEAAAEEDAKAAGFTTERMSDADQVASGLEIARRMAGPDGKLAAEGRLVLMSLSGAERPKPRSRGLVLTLQAVINELGLPAFLQDRKTEGQTDESGKSYASYATDLVLVWPS